MKKLFLSGLIFIFSIAFAAQGYCWPWDKQGAAASNPLAPEAVKAEASKASVAPQNAVEATQEAEPPKSESEKARSLKGKMRKQLNDTQWEIEIMPLSGKGAKEKDELVFKDNKFSSQEYSRHGFQVSNYTLSLQDETTAVVETMQTSEKEGIVFWRVEFDAAMANCKGVLSRQLSGNKTEDYSFVSVAKKPVSNMPAAEAQAPAPEEPQAQAPAKQKPKTGKK